MKEFLKKLDLSENAINIYLQIVGSSPYTYYELKTVLPKIEDEEFENTIEELKNHQLLLDLKSEKPEIVNYYYALPPINPILNYYSNIDESFSNIENAIQDLIVKSVSEIFQKENKIELDSLYNEFQDIKKDFEEDSLLQKKDAEDISREIRKIEEIEEEVSDLQKRIKNIIQTEFGNLIKIIGQLRKTLINKIEELELKKREELVIETIEEVFKAEVDKMVEEFTIRINNLIEEKFEQFSLDPIITKTIQQRNDFKMLLLNLISSFEMKMKRLTELIKQKKQNLEPNIDNLKNRILSKLNIVIINSLEQIANLNQPIIKTLSYYQENILKPENLKVDDIWKIETNTLMNEQIVKAINTSQEELVIIVPNLKDYLAIELFRDLPKNLKIKVASSDPHVNSKVMKFKSIENLEFRNYETENFIGIKSDNRLLCMGFIDNESKDPLKNFMGLGINNPKLVNIFKKALYNVWSAAEPDYGGRRKTPMSSPMTQRVSKPQPQVKKVSSGGSQSIKEKEKISPKQDQKISEKIGEELKTSIEEQKGREEQVESQEKRDFSSKIGPKLGDAAGTEINNAFNSLLQKLNDLTGQEFAQELEQVADLVLEKRGFSVTLHDLRRTINDYKNQRGNLTGDQMNHIYEKIETWKQKLL